MTDRDPRTPARRLPCRGETLVEALLLQATERGDQVHLRLRGEDDGPSETLSFAQLADGARAVARALERRGVGPGDNVALMLPTCREFFFSFTGTLLANAVPVPIYPPLRTGELEEYVARHAGILENAAVKVLVTFREAEVMARLLGPRVASLETVVLGSKLLAEGRGRMGSAELEVDPEDLALIQYTSGSTGVPKGVTLSHANLVANIRSIGEAVAVDEDDVVVSWLPLYHDMGLIGCWLFALCHGLEIVSFSPLAFLRRPKRWLQAMSAHRGTLSPAPNFAYDLCLKRIKDRDLVGLDLSAWRWALNGSEPVNPDTLERFIARFSPYGFRPQTLKPVYGLAENTVALTFPGADEAPRVDRLDRDAFQKKGRAVPAAKGEDDPLAFVSVGRPIPANEVRVVGRDGEPVGERVEGEIEFRGPSATEGYYRFPEATAEIKTDDGWTRTGDLGYTADGDLFISGRSKDVIIKAGRNVHPQEVEAIAAEVEGVRKGCVAAFGVELPEGGEGLVVVAETRSEDREARRRMSLEIRRRMNAVYGVAPDAVELVPPHSIPKTPSGKLRRAETKARFTAGKLRKRPASAVVQVVRLALGSAGHALRRRLGWARSETV